MKFELTLFLCVQGNNTDHNVHHIDHFSLSASTIFSIHMFFYNTITFSDVGTSGYGKQSSLIFIIGQTACFEQ